MKSDKEYVTTYIRKYFDVKGGNMFTGANYPCLRDYSKTRMTVDGKDWMEYTDYIIKNNLMRINKFI